MSCCVDGCVRDVAALGLCVFGRRRRWRSELLGGLLTATLQLAHTLPCMTCGLNSCRLWLQLLLLLLLYTRVPPSCCSRSQQERLEQQLENGPSFCLR